MYQLVNKLYSVHPCSEHINEIVHVSLSLLWYMTWPVLKETFLQEDGQNNASVFSG